MTSAEAKTRILVVEDNAAVREIAVKQLRQIGFDVVAAGEADAALAMLAADPDIRLLFTDIVMPGPMTGDALARRARQVRPGLKVLLTTGYAEGAFRSRPTPIDTEGFSLLRKPYRRPELERRIREVLESA